MTEHEIELKLLKANLRRFEYMADQEVSFNYENVLNLERRLMVKYNELPTYNSLYTAYYPLMSDIEIKKLITTLELLR